MSLLFTFSFVITCFINKFRTFLFVQTELLRNAPINNVTQLSTSIKIKDSVENQFELIYNEEKDLYSTLIDEKLLKKPYDSDIEYKFIKLANELEVFLINSPKLSISSATLHVKVGSMMDPEFLPGLAHYLEHMIFINTEEYPQSGDFSRFVNVRGGFTNALTHLDKTTYVFTIATDFEEALNRFSSMFKNPLFDPNYMEKELYAIDNEFELAKHDDFMQVVHILSECADKESLFHRFILGNSETLDRIPKSKGINVRKEIIKFYNNEYSSNRMVLALAGNYSLDELTKLAVKYFSDIKNKKLPVLSHLTPHKNEGIFNGLSNKVLIIDSPQTNKISLYFPLKYSPLRYKLKYLVILIKEYVLINLLTLKKYINIEELMRDNSHVKVHSLNILDSLEFSFFLIENGKINIPLILESFFSIFKSLMEVEPNVEVYRKNESYLLDSNKAQNLLTESKDILFTYFESECKPEDVLIQKDGIYELDKEYYYEVISQITPQNMKLLIRQNNLRESIINSKLILNDRSLNSTIKIEMNDDSYIDHKINKELLLDYNFTVKDIIKEKYTSAEYIIKELNPNLISYLSEINKNKTLSKFEIIHPNKFDHTTHIIKSLTENIEINKNDIPFRLKHFIEIYAENHFNKIIGNYHQFYKNFLYYPIRDQNLKYVKFILYFEFPIDETYFNNSNLINRNTRNLIILHQLFEKAFKIKYASYGKNFFKYTDFMCEFPIIDFLENVSRMNVLSFEITAIYSKISEIMSNFGTFIHELPYILHFDDFNSAKDSIKQNYLLSSKTFTSENFYNLISRKIKFNHTFSPNLMLKELNKIEFQDFIEYTEFFTKYSKIRGFIIGNINEFEVIKVMESFMHNIGKDFSSYSNSHLNSNSHQVSEKNHSFQQKKYIISYENNGNLIKNFENLRIFDFKSLKYSKIYFNYQINYKYPNVVFLSISIGDGIYNRLLSQILISIIWAEYMNELRTEKKLAYEIHIDCVDFGDRNLAMRFWIVSFDQNIKKLSEHLLEFWNKWCSYNSKLITESLFETSKNAVLVKLNDFPKNFFEIKEEFRFVIEKKTYDFFWRQKAIKYLNKTSFGKFKHWLKNVYSTAGYFLYAVQSSKNNHDELDQLKNYVPFNFTKYDSSKSIFKYPNVKVYSKKQFFLIE